MRRTKLGFTLIEVSLFIAITGALFVAIIVGTQNSIWQQKFNDSVQNYTNFLRKVYSDASNTQGLNGGRSDKAIYGKLISFGQEYDFNGELIPSDTQKVFVYDVIGDAVIKGGTGSINTTYVNSGANVLIKKTNENGNEIGIATAGIAESYVPTWGAVIENTTEKQLYTGSILVVRHPKSGLINTLVSKKVLNINYMLNTAENYSQVEDILTSVLALSADNVDAFRTEEIDFCLNPYGMDQTGTLRRDIRIVNNARNASGVEIIDLVNDKTINKCANT